MNDVFEVKKKKIEIKLPDGSSIMMTRPTIKEINVTETAINEAKKSGDYTKSVDLVQELMFKNGMTKEILEEQFDAESFAELYVHICGAKKK